MILSFRDKRTTDFSAGKRVKALSSVAWIAHAKLDRLRAALSLSELAAIPGNRFEALKGN